MKWQAWIRAAVKDPATPCELPRVRYPLAGLTGQDTRALDAVVACWALHGSSDDDGRAAAITSVRALLRAMQPQCWPIARELIAYALDWSDRERLWPLVKDCNDCGAPQAECSCIPY